MSENILEADLPVTRDKRPFCHSLRHRERPPSKVLDYNDGIEFWLGGISCVQSRARCQPFHLCIDCAGNKMRKGYHQEMRHRLIMNVPWNMDMRPKNRRQTLLNAASTLSEDLSAIFANHGGLIKDQDPVRVLFFCKMGERRSAGVLCCIMTVLCGFSVDAACEWITKARPSAWVDRKWFYDKKAGRWKPPSYDTVRDEQPLLIEQLHQRWENWARGEVGYDIGEVDESDRE